MADNSDPENQVLFTKKLWGNSHFSPLMCTSLSFWSLTKEKLQNSPSISTPLVNLVQTVSLTVKVNKNADLSLFWTHVSMMSRPK
jgi:hypothetical protein